MGLANRTAAGGQEGLGSSQGEQVEGGWPMGSLSAPEGPERRGELVSQAEQMKLLPAAGFFPPLHPIL